MELRKGIVAEVQNKDSVIVLTSNGDILEVKTNGKRHEIGDEILFYSRPKTREGKWGSRALRYTAGLAATLLFFFSNPFSTSELGMNLANLLGKKDAYAASVFIESKSNVKVGVSGDHKVINVEPLNKPAKFVLKDMKWSGRPIDQFVEDYFETAKETGYLGPEDSAIIAVDPETEKDDILETIQKDVTESPFIAENDIKVITVSVPNVVVEKAKALGLTPGKFSIYLAASKLGKKIPVDVVKVATVTEIVDAVPVVAKVLPSFSEETLAQLVNGGTPNTANQSTPSEPETASTSTSEQSAANSSKGAQSSFASSTDSATTVNSSDSQQQSEPQPQSQDDSSNGSSSSNKVDTPESQKQEGQTKEDQPQEQPQEDQTQQEEQPQGQTQEGQSQDNQAQQQEGQPQSNQSQNSQPQQDDQTQGQTQQSDQSQSNQSQPSQSQQDPTQSNQPQDQSQNSQDNGNTTSDQQPSVAAAISETVSGLVNKITG